MGKIFKCECWFLPGQSEEEINERIFYANEYVAAFFSYWPITDYHFLAVPIRHVADEKDLSEREILELNKSRIKISNTIEEFVGLDSYNLLLNQGSIAGRTVKHLHYHTVFRKDGDLKDSPLARLLEDTFIKEEDKNELKEKISLAYQIVTDPVGGIRNVIPGSGNYKKYPGFIPQREEDVLRWTKQLKRFLKE